MYNNQEGTENMNKEEGTETEIMVHCCLLACPAQFKRELFITLAYRVYSLGSPTIPDILDRIRVL